MQARFIGTIEAKLDQKGRAFLPAQFRKQLREAIAGDALTLVLRKDVFEPCLVLYTEAEWTARLDELRGRLSIWSRADQALFREFVAQVEVLTLDSSGRLLLPRRYLQMAGIESGVTFVGMDRVIEIWPSPYVARVGVGEGETFGGMLEERFAPK